MVWMIMDFLLIACCVVCIVKGCAKGLMATLLNMAACIVAFAVAGYLSGLFAPMLFESLLEEPIVSAISSKLSELANGESVQSALSSGILGVLLTSTGQMEKVVSIVESLSGDGSVEAAESIVEKYVSGTAISIIRTILVIIIFMFALILVRLLVRALTTVNMVPILGPANRIFGGVFGLCEGLVICWVFVMLLSLVLTLMGKPEVVEQQALSNTVVFSFLYEFNPLTGITF